MITPWSLALCVLVNLTTPGCSLQLALPPAQEGSALPAAPSQMEARVAPGQDLTGAAMATFLYDRLVAEEAG